MRIQHNIMAMNAYRNYNNNTSALSKNLEKLSSGYKINRAGDDAAGLAISEKMRAQITGLKTATKNVKDGVSLVKTAEGALQEVHDMLNRMDSLATQSANGTYDDGVDRLNLQKEVDALRSEIDRIADSSNFNGLNLLDGSLYSGTSVAFASTASTNKIAVNGTITADSYEAKDGTTKQLTFEFAVNGDGAETKAAASSGGKVTITLKKGEEATADVINKAIRSATVANGDNKAAIEKALKSVTFSGTTTKDGNGTGIQNATGNPTNKTGSLTLQIGDTADKFNKLKVNVGDMHAKGLGIDKLDISSQTGAAAAIQNIKDAINKVSSTRGDLGAIQNRLEHTQNNLSVMTENIQDAESTVRDTDVADEMMAYTKNNILVQSAQAMLAQANQVPQGVLQLLQ
ncbi:flagellin [Intestinimonas sp. MSJ-38]|uniref:flagellin N-terminal helical domain-containing protein n=1 Tax=Intestinimonas sp. MSJ-38 TaxID=2841532 RepID=UPI001C108F10|nr:flagellin [Intestinimonas sp. MSJ-38]MBU5431838.1 flagellin [Intestinimonas sp. MSJ-38]